MQIKLLLRRFFAFLIDWNIIFLLVFYLMYLSPQSNIDYLFYPSFEMIKSAGFLLTLVLVPFYFLFKDCIFGRRSLGKLICGLSVKNENGGKASYLSLILRNLTFFVIQIEALVVLLNKGKRIGDILAKTQVVLRTK